LFLAQLQKLQRRTNNYTTVAKNNCGQDSPPTRARVDTLVVAKIATTKKGERLTAIKSTLQHGQWIHIINEQLPFCETQARNYIRIYNNRQRVADLDVSMREAVKLLSTPKPKKEPIPVQAELVEEEDIENRYHHKAGVRG